MRHQLVQRALNAGTSVVDAPKALKLCNRDVRSSGTEAINPSWSNLNIRYREGNDGKVGAKVQYTYIVIRVSRGYGQQTSTTTAEYSIIQQRQVVFLKRMQSLSWD